MKNSFFRHLRKQLENKDEDERSPEHSTPLKEGATEAEAVCEKATH